jgi:tetratricopeptide (TPR) repeat protein
MQHLRWITRLAALTCVLSLTSPIGAQTITLKKTPEPTGLSTETFYQALVAELLSLDGKVGDAFSLYLSMARKTPHDDFFERAIRIALSASNGVMAKTVAQEWTMALPQSAQAHNYAFQLQMLSGNLNLAAASLHHYLRLAPPYDQSSIILGLNNHFARAANKAEAVQVLTRVLTPYLQQTITQAATNITLARAQIDAGLYNLALAQLKQATQQTPDHIDAWLLLGILQTQENLFAEAASSLQQFLTLAQKNKLASNHAGYVQAYLNLAQLAEHRKDYAAAQNWLSKIEDNKERLTAQTRRASILAKQGQLAQARALIRELPEPTQAQARAKLLAEVHLLRDHKALPEAIAMLDKALAADPLDTNLMYELSTLHDKAKNFDTMEALLRRIIVLEPNNQAAYNALGYSLADRSVRLDEAQTLIEKALAITPDDPYIVDSLAWVFYRAGKLEQALKTLQSAYKTRADAEIGAHLGEVLWMMNRKEEARQAWRDARVINPDNETLVETLKRFDVKL